MPGSSFGEVLRLIRSALDGSGLGGLSDAQLLERFFTQREERAFAVLVERHGPMVLSVCRRIMRDSHQSEDAFQAAFLVLIRKSTSLTSKQSVGGWLHGVARRVALRGRAQSALRRQKEREATIMSSTGPLDELTLQELRSVLDEEIASLSEKYQGPIVLCHLEGKTYDEAARELGCTKITLSRRLTKARALLRRKLERRGITLSLATLPTALTEAAQAAPLPAFLALNTVKAATLVATGKTAASGCLSAGALALAEEALTGMLLAKGKLVVMVMALGLALGGAGWAGYKVVAATGQTGPGVNAQMVGQKKQMAVKEKELPAVATDQYGDPLPDGAVWRFGSARLRHGGTIYSSALSRDGKILATAGKGSVILWDLETEKALHQFRGDPESTFGYCELTFSPDGKQFAYRNSSVACIWDIQNAKELRRFEPKIEAGKSGPWLSGGRFLNGGKEFILSSNYAIHIWNLDNGQETSATSIVGARGFSPDGKYYWRDDAKSVAIVLAESGTNKELWRIADVRYPGSSGLAFSQDGKLLAVTVSNNVGAKEIQIRDLAAGKVSIAFLPPENARRKQNHENSISEEYSTAFSGDGKSLFLGTWSGYIHRFDVATGKELSVLSKHHCEVTGMHTLPDGRTLISTGHDGVIRRWDLQTGRHDAKPESYEGRTQGVFSADGRFAVVGDTRGRIDLWDAHSGKIIRNLQQEGIAAFHLAFAPDCKLLAAAEQSGTVRFWQVPSGKPSAVWQREPTQGEWQCNGLHFSPNGRSLCISDYPKQLRMIDVDSGKLLWVGPSSRGEAFYPDGATLLVAGPAGPNLSLYDVKTGHRISTLRLNVKSPNGLGVGYTFAFSPDGRQLALGSDGGTLMLCDGRTCEEKRRLADGDNISLPQILSTRGKLPNQIHALAFTPDSKWFASAGSDGAVYIWETITGQEIRRLLGHDAAVTTLSFSPDGRNIFSFGQDGQGYAWNISPKSKAGPRRELKELWSDLADKKAAKAYEALWAMIATPKDSVSFLNSTLKAARVADAGKVQKWIADLDSETFAVRQAAATELEKIGEQVQVPIRKALQAHPPLETRRRMEQILAKISEVPSQESLRTIRAIMALERIGNAEARGVLEALAGGAPGARETEEARASLERLTSWAGKTP